jgi:hypothetical protein
MTALSRKPVAALRRQLMADSRPRILQRIIQGCSRLLLLVGAAVFFAGDKFLHEIIHVKFLISEVVGILGGVLLMLCRNRDRGQISQA